MFLANPSRPGSDRRGAVLVLFAILLPILFLLSAYVIHVAYVESVQSRAQLATDAIARSAGREYQVSGSESQALTIAKDAAQRNTVEGVAIPLAMSDLQFGTSMRSGSGQAYSFTPFTSGSGVVGNSVRITTTSLNSSNVLQPVFPTFGVAAPIRPLKVATHTRGTIDIAVVLDRSGSMCYASNEVASPTIPPAAMPVGWQLGDPVPNPSRWIDLVQALEVFLQELEASPVQEKVSLATFSSDTRIDQDLTFDYQLIRNGMATVTNSFQGGATAIGSGMDSGRTALSNSLYRRDWAIPVVILMTDGIHNTGGSPESRISGMKNNGITLYSITFSDEADQGRMSSLAGSLGGAHFHATNASQLTTAFQEIGKRLPSLLTE